MTKKPTKKPKALTKTPKQDAGGWTRQLTDALRSVKSAATELSKMLGTDLDLPVAVAETKRRFETIEAWKLAIHERLAGFLERRPKPSRITLAATTQAIEALLEQVLDREAKAERELGADRRRIGDQLRRILGVQLRYHTVDELLAMAEERLRDAPKSEDVQALIAERDEANALIRTLAHDLSSGDEQEKIDAADIQTCRETLRAKVAELTTLSMMLETVGTHGTSSAPVNGVMLLSASLYNAHMSERERILELVSMSNEEILALVDGRTYPAATATENLSLVGKLARRLAELADRAPPAALPEVPPPQPTDLAEVTLTEAGLRVRAGSILIEEGKQGLTLYEATGLNNFVEIPRQAVSDALRALSTFISQRADLLDDQG